MKGVRCFRCWGTRHLKLECPNIEVGKRRRREEEMVYVARLQKVQQQGRPACSIQEKVQEYYKKQNIPPKNALLLEKGQITRETMATYIDCGGCKGKGVQTRKNQGQGFFLKKQLRNVWYNSYQKAWNWRKGKAKKGKITRVECIKCERRDAIIKKVLEQERKEILCPECRVERKRKWQNWEVVVWPTETKVQQSSTQTEGLKGAAREGGEQRDLKRIFKILKEIQLNIGVEKVDMHESVTIKVLLDSSTTEMFMDRKIIAKYGFRLQKLERSVVVRNVDGTNNSAGVIMHQVEANIYYKNHVERMQMDICNLGKTDIILDIPWLQAHNLEINQETGEVKMMRCPPLYGRNTKLEEEKRANKGKRVATLEEEKIVRWIVDNKENWEREEEVEVNYRKIEEIVPQKFLK